MSKTKEQAAFGDFQTPLPLAQSVATLVEREEPRVQTVVEPTCGVGSFLEAVTRVFGKSPDYYGFDINPEYVVAARTSLNNVCLEKSHVEEADFYQVDWKQFFSERSAPLLVIGNPPWITNSGMGAINGRNLPQKSNFQRHSGFAAKTGKANFDISEWMLRRRK